jgi:hypothetical protein
MLSIAKSLIVAAAFSELFMPSVALGHHGWTGYQEEPVTLTGTIREAAYQSPHGSVSLESPGKIWHVVLAPPARMAARGLPPEALQSGATATITGYPHRSNAMEMRAERITVAGKTTELR